MEAALSENGIGLLIDGMVTRLARLTVVEVEKRYEAVGEKTTENT